MVRKWLHNVLIGIDQLINAILCGDPDETISSRAYKMAQRGFSWPMQTIDRLFGPGHCADSEEKDEGRNSL